MVFVMHVSPVHADESVVIDSSMLGTSPAEEPKAGDQTQSDTSGEQGATQDESIARARHPVRTGAAAEANLDRLHKSGKMSARQRVEVVRAEVGEKNSREGEDFLEQNAKKPGVVTLPSGVQYKILHAGKGKKPTEQSFIECRFRGTTLNGVEFDKSEGQDPIGTYVAAFLPGLREAVKLMPVNSKWRIVIPAAMGYGELANRGVGPNSVLIYEMEIVHVY